MNTRACDVLSAADVSGIIAMAWSDDTPFEAIEQQFGLSEAEVIASVKKQLSGYKAPKRVVFVSEVPRAPNGKADYPGARALAEK